MRPFRASDEAAVIALWDACGLTRPWNDPIKDIRRKLSVRPEWFLVGSQNGEVVATMMVGYDGHRGWIYYLGVKPSCRKQGIARRMLDHAEKLLRAEGCPKINLQVRASNLEAMTFYEAIGFSRDDVLSFGKRLEHDGAVMPRRTV